MSDDNGSVDEVSKDQLERGISIHSQITQFAKKTIGLVVKMMDFRQIVKLLWAQL